jgi:hypothetical protein
MRKDDGKRLGAAVINWNFYSTHRHEKRRCQGHGSHCYKKVIFIQLTAMRKDDAKRLGAAAIKGNYCHEKRRHQAPGCRCYCIFIQLTAVRKDDAKRLGAAVI